MTPELLPVVIKGRTSVLDTDVIALATDARRRSAADVSLEFGATQLSLHHFATYASRINGEWWPTVWAASFGSRLLVVGLLQTLVFDLDARQLTCCLTLFRSTAMDQGWIDQILVPLGTERLAMVYEGGVVGFDKDLRLRWHRPKTLNDHFVEASESDLTFLSDEATYMLRATDGSLW